MIQSEVSDSPEVLPDLSEETSVEMCRLINNHIEVLRAWERKLKQPFLPQPSHLMRVRPAYGNPTLATLMHVYTDGQRFAMDVRSLALITARKANMLYSKGVPK